MCMKDYKHDEINAKDSMRFIEQFIYNIHIESPMITN